MKSCYYCRDNPDILTLYSYNNTRIVSLSKPHISNRDGGHLIVVPNRHVRSRTDLSPLELLTMDFLSILAAEVLKKMFDVNWFNFQENGNWSLDDPNSQHSHLHVYGRKVNSINQTYGECLIFPKKNDLKKALIKGLSNEDIMIAQELFSSEIDSPKFANFKLLLNHLSTT